MALSLTLSKISAGTSGYEPPPAAAAAAAPGADKGKGKKGIRGRKHSFRKVMHRMQRYLTNHPNDEAQEYLDSAKANMKTLYGMKKDGVKDGFKELVKETRQLLRKAIKIIREARKGD